MISCKEATRLASLRMERRLTPLERFQLWIHLGYCVGCRRAEKQFLFLRRAMGSWIGRSD